ncbi:hypothetical protein [Streptomyces sp. NBC_00829]|uniref:hypothetical protein n=1 Tax=Streptomyces sp. NBC_00829 TaxID=2903679 RepID=UPI00386FE647|nr:hypothetical protein OG293_04045 [Streptomyces sp. NBC_00829]
MHREHQIGGSAPSTTPSAGDAHKRSAGDVRKRSIKRVTSAVREGATAVRLVHEYLDT